MTCERYREMISARMDGELTEAEQSELDAHLAECSGCSRVSNEMHGQDELLANVRLPSRPAHLRSEIRKRIGFTGTPPERPIWHVGSIPERPIFPNRTSDTRPSRRPIIGPLGRA